MQRNEYQRLYATAHWKRLRALHLSGDPLCAICKQQGYRTVATVVDHIKAHRGDLSLFYDAYNLQSLCKLHHDSVKQAEEKGGVVRGCTKDGLPLDPSHRWGGGVKSLESGR